jgi:hypothetical protein
MLRAIKNRKEQESPAGGFLWQVSENALKNGSSL